MWVFKVLQYASLALLVMSMFACTEKATKDSDTKLGYNQGEASFQVLTNRHFKPPRFENINLQIDQPGSAIWGATGRDHQGKMYFGLSNELSDNSTAYLVQYDPDSGQSVIQSDTLIELKRAKLFFPGISQNKLQSKFVLADDGYLYFSSFDETGQTSTKNPVYGGNLWRKLPGAENWEHLASSDEALIAVQANGQFIYALGYWGHVLYQYDTMSQRINKLTIGSVDGHVSKNFVVNQRGHAFVPRVERTLDGQISAVLVELNPSLAITDIHPLEDYVNPQGYGDDGIVSYTLMKNGDAYFTVASGGLYRITESATGRHTVDYLGKFDPQFENNYLGSLFSPDGESLLVGLGRSTDSDAYHWYIRELSTQVTVSYLVTSIPSRRFSLFGSYTTDAQGNMYIVGADRGSNRQKQRPVVLKASYQTE